MNGFSKVVVSCFFSLFFCFLVNVVSIDIFFLFNLVGFGVWVFGLGGSFIVVVDDVIVVFWNLVGLI